MSIVDHEGFCEIPVAKDLVFDTMCKVIPTISGMKIDSSDKLLGRIVAKAGVSLFSWGENIPIQLMGTSDNTTKISIVSSPKTGVMFGGAFDMGKNRKNIEMILSATSAELQRK